MERDDRSGRDAAGVGPYARERESLTPLSSLDSWTVSEGEPDIRGWEVRTVSGRQLGSIADLLIDPGAGEVVLLDIDLPATDRHTFVPIRVAQIDRARRVVLMDSADIPASDLTRPHRTATRDRRVKADRVVRYPRTDREIVADRAALADVPPLDSDASVHEAAGRAAERRRGDRRRIDRVSTDL
jgi:hypothetical protein